MSWELAARAGQRLDRDADVVEEVPTAPFEEVRRRVCESILSHPDMYRDDEAVAGEDAPPRDEQEMLDEVADAARAASNMLELIDVFDTLGREG